MQPPAGQSGIPPDTAFTENTNPASAMPPGDYPDDACQNMDPDDPDVIRERIEATRRELSADVDALGDKVDPAKDTATESAQTLRDDASSEVEHLRGEADQARHNVQDR